MNTEKGKNFSCNNTGKRKKSDFYETPYSITRQFLEMGELDKEKSIVEPACGNGAISKVLEEFNFKKITSFDLSLGKDFLLETNSYDQLITNPPFSLAFQFIQKAKEIIKDKFVFLLPLSYLHGKQRYDKIYSDKNFKLSCVYIFTRYPMLGDILRDSGKYRTGMMVYAWFIWDKNYKDEPIIKWLDNNKYVLSKKDN